MRTRGPAIASNHTVSADRLLEVLWGATPPATAAKTLQVHISHLRKSVPLRFSDRED